MNNPSCLFYSECLFCDHRYRHLQRFPYAHQADNAPQPVKAPEKKGDTRPPRGNRSQQAARRQLTICETGISKLEAECRRLDEEMAAHACDAGELNRLYQEKQEVEARLEQEMARWEELSLQIEE